MPIRKKKIRRWFFEKVDGCQFHPMFSKCDDFSVRLQIRKSKDVTWAYVAESLKESNYHDLFENSEQCTKNETKLIGCYRSRRGNHKYCSWGQKNKKMNWHIDLSDKKSKKELIECFIKLAS